MKTRYLLFAATASLVLAGCSDEQYLDQANVGYQDGIGTLIETPMLGVGLETEAATRAYDDKGNWTWIPEVTNGQVTAVDAIGLCWTGVNNNAENGYPGPLATTGENVYSNYKFEHAGWMYAGETDAKYHCGVLNNGAYHGYFQNLEPQATYANNTWTASESGKELDFATGIFKGTSGTIYSGEYIIYSPYNASFWNAPVTAMQDREMTLTLTDQQKVQDKVELMTKYGFTVGYAEDIAGGDAANKFKTQMLSSGLHFYLSTATEKTIKEIVLWTKGQNGFILKQQLSAAKIKETLAKEGLTTDIYLNAGEAVSSIVVKLGENGLKFSSTDTQPAEFYIPFLPYTEAYEDLRILLIDNEGKTAVLQKENVGPFAAGHPSKLTLAINADGVLNQVNSDGSVKVAGTAFSAVNYAYDNDSFWRAYGKAFLAGANATEEARTVSLLDDVTLTDNASNAYYINATNKCGHAGVIIKAADGETAKLTLGSDENTKFNRNLPDAADNTKVINYVYGFEKTIFGVDVETVPWGCCNEGKISVSLGDCSTLDKTNFTINGGTAQLGGKIEFAGNFYSLFEPVDAEGESHIDQLARLPQVLLNRRPNEVTTVTAKGEFVNAGLLQVKMADTGVQTTILKLVGGQLTNLVTTQGEGAAAKTHRGLIEVQGNGELGKDGSILMEGNTASLTNYGDITNRGNIDNNAVAGSFVNKAAATFTDYVGSSLSGYRIVNEDATSEYICEVNSLVRYANAIDLEGIRPTTTVRFVYGKNVNIEPGDFTLKYTLKPNKNGGIYVPYAKEENQLVKFESAIDAGNTLVLQHATDDSEEANPIATTIGDFTVRSSMITIEHEALTIDGDYNTIENAQNTFLKVGLARVTGDMNFDALSSNARLNNDMTLTVDGDINVNGIQGTLFFNPGSTVYAKNMTVASNQKVTFDKNNVTYIGVKTDASTGTLTNNGAITIVNAVSGSDVAAKVWCNHRAGNGTYTNSSPQYYQ